MTAHIFVFRVITHNRTTEKNKIMIFLSWPFQDPVEDDSDSQDGNDDTKILLEKEFDDFYEDRVHKSAGPVVFVSKALGMLPVIWTEDETENECKSYFNLYTFIIFIGGCSI